MRAGFIRAPGGPEVLEVGELPTPEPGPGEVRAKVKFAALNHLDLWIRKGIPGQKLAFPHVLGADGAGVVDKCGAGVNLSTGTEVILYPGISCGECEQCKVGLESLCPKYGILGETRSGTNAEYIVVPKANVFPKPASMTLQEAAAFSLVFVTAWEMLVVKAGVKAGHRVLIHGAGSGVSGAAIQIAKSFGAEVIVTSTSDEKLAQAKTLGADVLVNSRTVDFASVARKVDIIVDHVGKAFWEKNIRCLKSGGALVTCGATSGFDAATDLRHLFFRQLRLLGSTMGSKRDFPLILQKMESREFKIAVDRVFLLPDLVKAHEHLEAGRQFGKVLISL